jgi:hypothetical protein
VTGAASDEPPPAGSDAGRRDRDADAHVRAQALEWRRTAESVQARRLVADFVASARARGLRTEELLARGLDGRGRYRTGVHGWYLRRNRTLGVGVDGEFYVLTVAPSLRGRLLGTRLEPSDPPLVAGAGGRDGETIAMEDLLAMRLDAGDDWG